MSAGRPGLTITAPARRELLKWAARAALACCAPGRIFARAESLLANPVGYATITWPEREFPQALETISALGFRGVQMLGWVSGFYRHAGITRLAEQLRALKLQPVALSCSNVDLYPGGPDQSKAFRAYAEFFKALGGLYLQITDGANPRKTYPAQEIRMLASRMNALGKIAQESGLVLGYHPHLGTLGETREGLGRLLDATDARAVKVIADVAHLTLGGADPAEVIRTYHERLIFVHLKDVRKEVARLARQNIELIRTRQPLFSEIGTGVVDFSAVFRAVKEVDFRGWMIVELDEPGPNGPAESARVNKEAIQKLGLTIRAGLIQRDSFGVSDDFKGRSVDL